MERLEVFGLLPEDFDEFVEVWPVLWAALLVFEAMATQWRSGASGATGLDYSALPSVMDMLGIGSDKRGEVFQDVRLMEQEALRILHTH